MDMQGRLRVCKVVSKKKPPQDGFPDQRLAGGEWQRKDCCALGIAAWYKNLRYRFPKTMILFATLPSG